MSAGLLVITIALYDIFSSKKIVEETLASAEEFIGKTEDETKKGERAEGIIGVLTIPKIERKLPIVEGTSPADLRKGVGHYKGTALPSEGEQIVLSGHRDTVFTNFAELSIGDVFIVELSTGSYTYEIGKTKIVDADDVSIINPQGEEVLVVTTCYPFSYIGDAPNRFIFYAYPVEKEE